MKWTKLAADCESAHCLEFANLVADCDSSACLQIHTDETAGSVLLRESTNPERVVITSRLSLSAVIEAAKSGKLDHLIVGG